MADTTKPASGTGGRENAGLNALLTLAAPQLRRGAEELANWLKRDLPSDHFLRSDPAEIAINELASVIESASDGQKGLAKAALEKLSDFIENFASFFCEEDDDSTLGVGKKQPTKPGTSTGQTTRILDELDTEFLKSARTRLETAAPGEKESVGKQLQVEAEALAALRTLLVEGPKKPEEPKKPDAPKGPSWWSKQKEKWGPRWGGFKNRTAAHNQVWETKLASRKEKNRRLAQSTAQQKLSWGSRLLLWPWKLLWGLLMPGGRKPASQAPVRPRRNAPGMESETFIDV